MGAVERRPPVQVAGLAMAEERGKARAIPGMIAAFTQAGIRSAAFALLAAALTLAGFGAREAAAQATDVTFSTTALEVTEGQTASYTIVLDSQPSGNVWIAAREPVNNSGFELQGKANTVTSRRILTFTRDNWDTAQTVTVFGVVDAEKVNDASGTLTHLSLFGPSHQAGVALADVAVTVKEAGNMAPQFPDTTTMSFTETEGTATTTRAGQVGTVRATDPNNDPLTYSVTGGTDQAAFNAAFTLDAAGAVSVKAGQNYDHEAKASYAITVTADDSGGNSGSGLTGSGSVTINIDDRNEPPLPPTSPAVAAKTGTSDTLTVSWTAPDNTGRPAITHYKVRYRIPPLKTWTVFAGEFSGLTGDVTGLTPETEYEVHVRAFNAEGESRRSEIVKATTLADLSPKVGADQISQTRATLTVANHPSPWHHQRTSPSGGTCETVSTGGTASLTGLVPDTSYTWKTYSDSGCTTELASTEFETAAVTLTADPISHNAATLTVVNDEAAWWYRETSSSPPGACTAVLAGTTTASLASLTAGATYTFKAYLDSGCATESASETFSTPALRASAISSVGATLTLANHSEAWWYKHTSATPPGACTAVRAGTGAVTVGGLAASASHTFKAYSDSGCSVELAPVTFSTTAAATLTAGSITQTGATLTIGNHSAAWWYRQNLPAPPGTCTAVRAGTSTASPSGLTAGTSHTFTAYVDGGCSTKLASETFRTAALTQPATVTEVYSGTMTVAVQHSQGLGFLPGTGSMDPERFSYKGESFDWVNVIYFPDGDFSLDIQPVGSHPSYASAYTLCFDGAKYYEWSGFLNPFQSGAGFKDLDSLPGPWSENQKVAVQLVEGRNCPGASLTADAVTQVSATLRTTNHPSPWHHKRTSPSGGTCAAVSTGATANLAGLTPATAYTWKTYSDSNCTDELASHSFSTKDVGTVLAVTPAELEIAEAATATFTAALKSNPQASVSVAVSSSDAAVATADPSSLTFTGSNWSNPQTVTVTGVANTAVDPGGGREAAIRLNATSTNAAFNLPTAQDLVAVTVADDDQPMLTASAITHNSATLTAANHPSPWRHKRTSPSGGTCVTVSTGATANLTGLTPSTSYTWKSYSDSNCTTELASRNFMTAAANQPPAFPSSVSLSLQESIGTATLASDQSVGTVAATDPEDDTLTYSVTGGTDQTAFNAAFSLDAATGEITAKMGQNFDHEAKPSYAVTIQADDGRGGTASIDITVSVTDRDEPPLEPGSLMVAAKSGTDDTLSASWTAPVNTGRPAIMHYKLRYRIPPETKWTEFDTDFTSLSGDITGLTASTTYQVRVQAVNAEGQSPRQSTTATAATNADTSPTLTVDEITTSGAKLTVTNHPSPWHHKRTSPSGGTCAAVSTGTTAEVTGLSPNTDYTWSTYSDSLCATTALASKSFKTAALPTVTVAAKSSAAVTEGTAAVFTLTSSVAAPTGGLAVSLKVAEAAGTDFVAAGGEGTKTADIAAGNTTAEYSVATVADTTDEPNGSVTVTLADGTAYDLGTAKSASVTVNDDDDTPTVTLSLTPASISENGGKSTVTAALDHPSSAATTVTVSAAAVSPTVAGDFTLSTNKALTIAAGATASSGVVTITATDNTQDGPNKPVTVSGAAANDRAVTGPSNVTLTITDDDSNSAPAGKPTITGTAQVAEELTAVVTGITDANGLTDPGWEYQWIQVNRNNERAIAGATGASLIVPRSVVGKPLKVKVTFTDDDGNAEELTSDATAAVAAGPDPGVTLSTKTLSVNENDTATYTLALSSKPFSNVSIRVRSLNADAATIVGGVVRSGWSSRLFNFTRSNWNTAQTVTVFGAVDAEKTNDASAEIRHYVRTGDGAGYSLNNEFTDARIAVTVKEAGNLAPKFPTFSDSDLSFLETVGAATLTSTERRTKSVAATDPNNDTLAYSIGGTDRTAFNAAFDFNTATGAITSKTGQRYDHEAKASYAITVTASDRAGQTNAADALTATATINVLVTDRPEWPLPPGKPTVTARPGVTGTLALNWTAPDNTGRPAITEYLVSHRIKSSGSLYTDHAERFTGLNGVVSGLTPATTYEVHVRATNDEGTGSRSEIAEATTRPRPSLAADGITTDQATLTVADHPSPWRHKRTSPGGGTCVTVSTGTTAELTGLTPNTNYTWKTYSDSNCTAELASRTFKTAPLPTVTVAADADSVTEGTAAAFTVTASPAPLADLTVSLNVATSGEFGYGATDAQTVTIDSGETTAAYSLTTTDDDADEPDGTVTVTVAAGTGYDVGTDSSAEVTVADDEERSVAWAGGFRETAANDGAVAGAATATLTGDEFSATAVSGGHVTANNVPAGLTAAFTRDSATAVTLTLTGNAGAHADANDVANLTVAFANAAFADGHANLVAGAANDDLVVDFSDAPPTTEPLWRATLTVGRNAQDERGYLGADTPEAGTEASALTPGATFSHGGKTRAWARIAAAGASATELELRMAEDGRFDRKLRLCVSDSVHVDWQAEATAAGERVATVGGAVAWSAGDEVPLRLIHTPLSCAARGQVTGLAATPTVNGLSLAWTAVAGADGYKVQWKSGSESYDAAMRQATVTSASHAIASLTPGLAHSVRVAAVKAGEADGAWSTEATGTPTAPALPTVTVAAKSSAAVTEGTAAVFTLTSSAAAPTGGLAVSLTVAESAGADFVAATGEGAKTATITAGNTTADYSVATVADTTDEPQGTVTVTLVDGTAYDLGTAKSASVTVNDDDAAPTVTLSLTPSSISESGGESTVTAALSHPSSAATTVTVSAAPVSPAVAGDFALSANKALTIAAGATASTGTVKVTANDNDKDEANKQVTVSGAASNTQGIAGPANVALTITEDDTNTEATGKPTISGTAQEGETLTAAAGTIDDGDGLTAPVTYEWQWIRVDGNTETDIANATASTYRATSDDVGKKLKVKASFTDDHGNAESRTSDATATVTASTLAAFVSNTGQTTHTSGVSANSQAKAQGFRTGSDAARYTLHSIGVEIERSIGSGTPSVAIYTASNGAPGTLLHTLTNPALSSASTGVQTFRAPDGAVLQADTQYFMVISCNPSCLLMRRTASAAEDTGASPGWSIDDGHRAQVGSSWFAADTAPLKIRVNGSVSASDKEVFGTTMTAGSSDGFSGYDPEEGLGFLGSDTFTYRGASFTLDSLLRSDVAKEVQFSLNAGSTAPTNAAAYSLCLNGTLEHSWTNQAFTVMKSDGSGSFNRGQAVDVRLVVGTTCPSTYLVASAATLTDTTATLTLGGHTTGWWYKRTSPTAGQASCTAVLAGTSTASLDGLDAGTAYTFKAYSDSGCTTELASETFTTAPAQVTGLAAAAAAAGNALDLTWSAAAGATGYEVQWMSPTDRYFSSHEEPARHATTTSTSHTIPGLTAGTAYTVRVKATATGAPDGAWSREATGTPTAPPIATPTVTVAAKSSAAVTEGTAAVFTLTSSASAPTGGLAVSLTVAEAAGTDFVAATGEGAKTATITAGNTTADYSVATVADTTDEPQGTVTVTLVDGTAYDLGTAKSASVTVNDDDDAPTVTLSLTPASISESGGESTVTAALNHPSSAATTVTVSADPVSPAVAGDFALSANKALTIAAGATASSGTVKVTAVDNEKEEASKRVTVSGAATNARAVTGPSSVILTINDNDANAKATGKPTITGTAQEGEDLTAAAGDIADGDGLTAPVTYEWQWIRVDGNSETDIASATASTYRVASGDVGKKLKVKAGFTDDHGNAESRTSDATATVTAAATAVTEVFSTTMTAGLDDFDAGWSGYSADLDIGRLSSNTFTYKGANFTLDHLLHADNGGEVEFSLNTGSTAPTYAAAYSLCLDGTVEHSWTNEAFTVFKGSGSTSFTDGQAVKVRLVEGTDCASISLVASAVTDATATLTLSGHTTGWWHKQTSPTLESPECTAVESGTSAVSLSSLNAGTAYTFKAYSDSGCSTELASETFTTAPAQVTGLAAAAAAAGNALDLTWTAASGATGYEVQWKSPADEDFSSTEEPARHATTTAASHTISDLTAGTAYTIRVRATATGAPDGAWSEEVTGTPTDPPPSLAAGSVTHNAATLTISNHTAAWWYKRTTPASTDCLSVAANTASVDLSGLASGTAHTYQAYSNSACTTALGSSVSFTTLPGQVKNVSVAAAKESLRLSWSQVTGATGYEVQWKSGQETFSSSANPARHATTTSLSYTITGLTGGQAYTVRVRASNAGGNGPWSGEGTLTAKSLDKVTGLMVAAAAAGNALDVSWTAVSGATRYVVSWKSADQDFGPAERTHSVTANAYTIPNLEAGTEYSVVVAAGGAGGISGANSDVATGTPTAPPPTVTVAADAASVNEGTSAAFTVTASRAPAANLTVNLTVAATGTFGYGSNTGAQTVTITSGQTTAAYSLTTTGDEIDEPNGMVTVTVGTGTGYTVGSASSASVTVADDDDNNAAAGKPTISGTAQAGRPLTAGTAAITDADGLTDPTYSYQWVRVGESSEADISGATGSTYVVAAADVGATLKVTVSFADDAGNAESLTSDATDTVTASTSETFVSNTGQANSTSVTTADSLAKAQGFRTGSNASGYTLHSIGVEIKSSIDSAAPSVAVYTASGSAPGTLLHTLINPALSSSTSSGVQTFTAPDNAALQANAQYFMVISCSPTCLELRRTTSKAEDTGASQGWSIDDGYRTRVGGNWSSAASTSLKIRVNGSASMSTATAPEIDVQGNSMSIPDGDTTPRTADHTDFGSVAAASGKLTRTFTIKNTGAGALTLTGNAPVTVGGDDAADFSVTAQPTSPVAASTGTTTFTVEFDPSAAEVRTATLSIASNDANENPYDFAIQGTGTVSLESGSSVTDTTATLTIGGHTTAWWYKRTTPASNDCTAVGANTATVSLSNLTASTTYTFKAYSDSACSTELAEETFTTLAPPPTVTVAAKSSAAVTEGTAAVFTLTSSAAAPTGGLAVSLTVAEAAGTDFVAATGEGAKTATITAGQTTADYSVTTVADATDEPNGSVTVTLVDGTAYDLGAAKSASVTVNDNDAAPTVTLSLSAASISENGGESTVTAALSHPSSAATTVTVSADPVSPAVAGDFALSANKALTIAAGATASSGTVKITANDNDKDEANKQVTVSGVAANTQGFTGPANVALTITDDDTNAEATGKPTITGTAQEGEELTAGAGDIADGDGLAAPVTYEWQWIRVDGNTEADIANATASTYRATSDDVGKKLKVKASFTDDDGNAESRTSDATATVTVASSTEVFSTTMTVGEFGAGGVQKGYIKTSNVGSVASGTFTYKERDFELTNLTVASTFTYAGFGLTSQTPPTYAAAYTLCADGNAVRSWDGDFTSATGTDLTSGSRPAWTVGQTVAVKLVEGTTCLESSAVTDTTATLTIGGHTTAWWHKRTSPTSGQASCDPVQSGTSTASLASLDAGTAYTFKAYSDSACTTELAAESFKTAPAQVTGVAATAASAGNALNLTWSTAAGATGYVVQWKSSGQSFGTARQATATSASHTIPNLTPSTTYTVRVKATATGAPDGAWSAETTGTPTAPPAVPPEIDVQGNGVSIPDGDTTPGTGDHTDFGSVAAASGKLTRTFTIKNTGAGALTLTGSAPVTLSGDDAADFSVTTQPTSPVAATTGTTTFTVEFDPSAAEVRTATLSIANNDANESPYDFAVRGTGTQPTVTVAADAASVTEGTAAAFTVTATPAPAVNLTVSLTVAATGAFGFGSNTGSQTVTINSGATTAAFSLSTADDSTDESNGSVTVTVASGTGYTVGTTSSASVTVNDDDTNTAATGKPTITGTAQEGQDLTAGAGDIADVDGLTNTTYSYQWIRVDGNNETDIANATSSTYRVASGDVGKTLKVKASFTDDDGNAESRTSDATATVTAAPLPSVTVAADAASVTEGTAAAFTVTASAAPQADLSVSLTVATTGAFGYGSNTGSQTVTISSGQTTAAYTLTTAGDSTDEPDGSVTVTVGTGTGYTVGAASEASVTVEDNDARSIAWSGSFSEAAANDGSVTGSVTATLTGGQFSSGVVSGGHVTASNVPAGLTAAFTRTSATVVTLTLTSSATAHASANDVSDLTVTFADGAFADGHASLVTGASKSDIAISFDDPPGPTVTLALSAAAIDESGASNVSTVTATLSEASTATTTVTVSATAVSPAVAADFTLSDNKTLTIAAGQTSSTGTVTVTAVDNNVDAPDKKVTVKGAATNSAGVTNPADVILTISDDEAAPTATLALSPAAVDESGATTSSTVTASLSHPSSELTTVRVSASPVSPATSADFRLTPNRVLRIAAGETASTGTVTVTARDNSVDALDKTVTVSGAATNTQGVTGPADAILTIRDDDVRTLAWAGGFTESAADDGTVLGSVTATLSGGRFSTGADASASNVPAGLTAGFRRVSATVVELRLNGRATAHADANDVGDLTVTFADAAFVDGGADRVTDAAKADLAIDFLDSTTPLIEEGDDDQPEVRAIGAPVNTELEVTAATPGNPPSGQRFLAGPVEVTFSPPLSGGQTARLCLALNGSAPNGTQVARFDNGQWQTFDTAVETIDGARFACATIGATSPFAVLAPMPTINPGGGGGGGGGGGSSAEVRIRDAEPAAEGSLLRFRVELGSPTRRRLDLLASTDGRTASDGADYLGFSRHPVTVAPGESEAWLEVPTARDADADEGDETLAVTLSVAPGSAPARVVRPEAQGTILDGPPPEAVVPLFLADGEVRHGFVRVLDRGWAGGTVAVSAIDDGGVPAPDSTLPLAPWGAAHFRSSDLEAGNAAKGLSPGIGAPTRGDWRLRLSGADVAALAYVRTRDGFVTPLAGTVPVEADGSLFVAFFNPGSNWRQVSLLRLYNPGAEDAQVTVEGTDDAGASPGTPVSLRLPGGTARTLTAQELERGAPGLEGALGDGKGKWRLRVATDRPIEAMSLLESPTGHLANLSAATAPRSEADEGTAQTLVPLFPPASDPDRRQGFMRVINRGVETTEVRIEARDDAGTAYRPVTLTVGAGQAVQFNSHDLEQGSPRKGLAPGIGAGAGNWRLAVSGPPEVVVLAYVRHLNDGFLTGMNALAPLSGGVHRVDFLNPGSNHRQVSTLRLVNPGPEHAEARITGTDSAGQPGELVTVRVPARRALEFTAAELESGEVAADGPNPRAALEGALGDGAGKWRLRVESDQPIRVMSLLESPTGHLANLSAGIEPWEEDASP